ncbi:MAG TPA: APC family permease [Verrucomicrobiae bacterium]
MNIFRIATPSRVRIKELLFGKPLRTEEEQVEQVGPAAGIPVLGLDALGSASYGPEAAMTILLPLGAYASGYIGWITACVIGVLLAAYLSYRQTIPAYPQGGGSFTVAKENLGPMAGLLAASALSIDYILNVAVAISAGVGALVSAVPILLPYTLPLCLGMLAILTVINLRGIRTAGLLLMLPTYAFIACLATTICIGVVKTFLAGGKPVPMATLPTIAATTNAAALWLLLRAFASGCTALTGVEAVSNAVPIFREPTVRNARRTLTLLVLILAFLLFGVAFLSHSYHITATHPGQAGYESLISQMVAAVTGRGAFYYVSIASVLMVLALSANTSFAGFPRVCRVLALDEYLPAEFAHRGSRLVYSAGIIVLTILAALLLIVFRGITDRLIPLFAVGAFGAFTLSQLGMVMHWRRSKEPGAKRAMIINVVGATVTGTTLAIIAVAKFTEGAWIIVLLVPVLILTFRRVQRYHARVDREISDDGPVDLNGIADPVIVIPLKRLDRVGRKALRLGLSLTPEVHVVQILSEEMKTDDLTSKWNEWIEQPAQALRRPCPKLAVLPSAYREFFTPLLDYLRKLAKTNPDRPIAVIVPELVEKRWYHFLFRHRATLLKGLLLLRGGPQVVIISAPWYVRDALKHRQFATGTKARAASEVEERPREQRTPNQWKPSEALK